MGKAILDGILEGFLISVLLFGPAFFMLVNTSIREGFAKGVLLASGVFLSDLLVVLLWLFGFSDYMQNEAFQKMFSFLAGTIMVLMGIKSFTHPYKAFLKSYNQRVPTSRNVMKGFLMNLVNPFTLILWFGVMSSVSLKYTDELDNYKSLLFVNILSILLMIFLVDMVKVFLSNLIGKRLSHRVFYFVNRYFGLVLVVIGLIFYYRFLGLIKLI